jgi:hypothetical protein
VTNSDLISSLDALQAIAGMKLKARASFAVALNLRNIQAHLTVLDAERNKLIDRHAQRDASGNLVPVLAMDASGKPVLDSNGAPQVLEGRVNIADRAAFAQELAALMSLDVSDVVSVKTIKLSDLDGLIEPRFMAGLLWMITDDSEAK